MIGSGLPLTPSLAGFGGVDANFFTVSIAVHLCFKGVLTLYAPNYYVRAFWQVFKNAFNVFMTFSPVSKICWVGLIRSAKSQWRKLGVAVNHPTNHTSHHHQSVKESPSTIRTARFSINGCEEFGARPHKQLLAFSKLKAARPLIAMDRDPFVD